MFLCMSWSLFSGWFCFWNYDCDSTYLGVCLCAYLWVFKEKAVFSYVFQCAFLSLCVHLIPWICFVYNIFLYMFLYICLCINIYIYRNWNKKRYKNNVYICFICIYLCLCLWLIFVLVSDLDYVYVFLCIWLHFYAYLSLYVSVYVSILWLSVCVFFVLSCV